MKLERYLQLSPFFTIHRAYGATTRDFRRWLSTDDLNFLQSLILLALFFEKNKEVSPSAMASLFQTSRGNISHCISFLERRKFLLRTLAPTDARSYRIILTKLGRDKAVKLMKKFDQLQSNLESEIGESKVAEINRGIISVTERFKSIVH